MQLYFFRFAGEGWHEWISVEGDSMRVARRDALRILLSDRQELQSGDFSVEEWTEVTSRREK